MPTKLSPIAVVEYSQTYLLDLIRHLTGWDQRSEVADKSQLNYLFRYLETEHISATTIVVETEYVDRHYLEDYAEYYARCFPSHPRKCSRVHFFSNKFSESEFIEALDSNNAPFISELSAKYLGYIVIRPIPHTFLAKVCLVRYSELSTHSNCKLIAKKLHVSLFGIPLVVEAAPFLEQDKVVSACATSALWMFFNASSHGINGDLPSPSAITKSAIGTTLEGARTFPNSGLTPSQVARSLKYFGFEPSIIELSNDFDELKEILYGYLNFDIPVLIAGSIYEVKENGSIRHAGKHLVCSLGFRLSGMSPSPTAVVPKLLAHSIEKIYVHDDRCGPYVRISMEPISFTHAIQGGESRSYKGIALSLPDKQDYFVPDLAIIGVYHKIRLSYFDIREMIDALYSYLITSQSSIESHLQAATDLPEVINHHQKTLSDITEFVNATIEISLTTNTDIKAEVRKSSNFVTFNGSIAKNSCLLISMPKYIWRCRLYSIPGDPIANSPTPFTDILFDATEVQQGQVLVGYISYSLTAERVWKYIEKAIFSNSWQALSCPSEIKQNISGFFKFFKKNPNITSLNTLYGPPGLPRRPLKFGEADSFNNYQIRPDVQIFRSGSTSQWGELDKAIKYIWIINEQGDLVVGRDVETEEENLGHPTLNDGRPARLGGELLYIATRNKWLINLRSRTYSSHLILRSKMRFKYLNNILQYKFSGLDVEIQEDEIPEPTPQCQ